MISGSQEGSCHIKVETSLRDNRKHVLFLFSLPPSRSTPSPLEVVMGLLQCRVFFDLYVPMRYTLLWGLHCSEPRYMFLLGVVSGRGTRPAPHPNSFPMCASSCFSGLLLAGLSVQRQYLLGPPLWYFRRGHCSVRLSPTASTSVPGSASGPKRGASLPVLR